MGRFLPFTTGRDRPEADVCTKGRFHPPKLRVAVTTCELFTNSVQSLVLEIVFGYDDRVSGLGCVARDE